MADLNIELAQPHDLYTVLELIEELLLELQEDGADIPWVNREKLHADIRRGLDAEAGTRGGPGRLFVILAKDEQGVAAGVLTLVQGFALYAGGEYGIVDEIYVRPQFRGHDVERQLLDEAVAIATRRKWVHLDSSVQESLRSERTTRFSEGLGL